MLRVLLVDDHMAIREGARFMLSHEPDMEVLPDEATNGIEAVELVQQHRPDIVLMDVRMPKMTGVEACVEIMRLAPNTGVILFSAHSEPGILTDALRAGGRGYIVKEATSTEILRAIRQVANGAMYIDPALAHELAIGAFPTVKLSPRETDVMGHLARGLTIDQIAGTLFISPETVRTHIKNASAKLDAANRTHAVALALHHRLISLEDK